MRNFIEAAIAAQKQHQFLDLLAGGVLLDRHVEMCTERAASDRRPLICDVDGHRKESLPLLWNELLAPNFTGDARAKVAEFWIDCRETRLKVMVVKDRVGKRVVVQTYPPGSCMKMFIGLDEHLVAIRVSDRAGAVTRVGVASPRRYAFWQSQI